MKSLKTRDNFKNIKNAIDFISKQVKNPTKGLPKEVFLFVSKLTPIVNVDLLIKDEKGRTLLSWRDDQYAGTGWHIPGGVIRLKEKMITRVEKVAKTEIGTSVKFDPIPIAVNELITDKETRGHFISFLYKCLLSSKFVPKNKGLKENNIGYLKWHETCPSNLIKYHEIYRKFI